MNYKKREKLYINTILENPTIPYPFYYTLSNSMINNEMLLSALKSLHSLDFGYYSIPNSHTDIFAMFTSGAFPIYKEKYIVGYFGGKMMYLESHGWKKMPATAEIFEMEHWLVC